MSVLDSIMRESCVPDFVAITNTYDASAIVRDHLSGVLFFISRGGEKQQIPNHIHFWFGSTPPPPWFRVIRANTENALRDLIKFEYEKQSIVQLLRYFFDNTLSSNTRRLAVEEIEKSLLDKRIYSLSMQIFQESIPSISLEDYDFCINNGGTRFASILSRFLVIGQEISVE